MFCVGLGFSLLSFFVIGPYYGGEGTPYIAYFLPESTEMTFEGIWATVWQWDFLLNKLGHFIQYNLRLGLPVLFLYWLDWRVLLAMAPSLVVNGLSWYPVVRYPELLHYSAPLVAWLMFGVIKGFARLETLLLRHKPTIFWRGLLAEVLLGAVVATQLLQGYLPLARTFDWPRPRGREDVFMEMLAQVPVDAALSAHANLASQAAQRETLRFFPDTRGAEWILLDVWFGSDPYGKGLEAVRAALEDPAWEVVDARAGVMLLRRGNGPPANLTASFKPVSEMPWTAFEARFGLLTDGLTLRGVFATTGRFSPVYICTQWEVVGAGAQPVMGVVSGTEVRERPLSGVVLFEELFARPGAVQDCTQWSILPGDRITLQFTALDAEGMQLPVVVMNPGDLNDDIIVLEETLLLTVELW